jgi:hypothetical protein
VRTDLAFVAGYVGKVLEKQRLVKVGYYATMPPTVVLVFEGDESGTIYRLTVEALTE